MPPPKASAIPPNISRRNIENPTDEEGRSDPVGPTELTCLSLDRTSSSVREHVVEDGGESPAPLYCGPTGGIRILEDVQIAPPRTTTDPHQTPAQQRSEKMPRTIKMPSESPASPDDDEVFRTPTRTPTQETTTVTITARPAGSARESASRDASRERATARAADAGALRSRAATIAAPLGAVATPRAPRGSAAAASAPRGSAAVASAPRGSAAVACAPRGSAGAAAASRDRTGTTAPRESGGKNKKPLVPHLAAGSGTITTPTSIIVKKTVAAKETPTPPGAPHNTPMTPATTIPARNQPISTSLTEIHRAKPQRQRSSSRQSERSTRSDRSTDPTPERSGSRSSLGPPLDEPRAMVQTPIPGYGPSAPTPFTSSIAPETPRTQKRAREEVDSDKSDQTKPAVRPKTDPSPASQASQVQPQPSTSYADQARTTRIAEENKIKTTAEVVETKPEAPPRKQKVREEIEARAAPAPAAPATTREDTRSDSQAASKQTNTLTNEPVVAAPHQGTKAKPASDSTALDAVRDVLIEVLQEVTHDLQRDHWELIVGGDFRRGRSGQPAASLTQLGWVIHGPVSCREEGHERVNQLSDLEDIVKKQFELDAIGISKESRQNSDHARAEKILQETSKRTADEWEVGATMEAG
ncbi:hypothetical protein ACJJTC_009228 [Scirpophaga incertulas]